MGYATRCSITEKNKKQGGNRRKGRIERKGRVREGKKHRRKGRYFPFKRKIKGVKI